MTHSLHGGDNHGKFNGFAALGKAIGTPNSTDKDRSAAAGRLRSAVALELAAGKVWALPIAVQPARGIRRRNGTGSP